MSLELDFEALVTEATSPGEDDEAYWTAVSRLRSIDGERVLSLVAPLATSEDPRLRGLVPDVLRSFGRREDGLRGRVLQILRELVTKDADPRVLAASGAAFNELGGPDGLDILKRLLGHQDLEVRRSAVPPLISWAPELVPELIALSADADAEIRNWATFALAAHEPIIDTPEIRGALAARLEDAHDETRAEAVLGLAVRNDPRCIPLIEVELTKGPVWDHYVEACEFMPDARFIGGLERVLSEGRLRYDAREALARCRATAK